MLADTYGLEFNLLLSKIYYLFMSYYKTHIDFFHIIDVSHLAVKIKVHTTADGRDGDDACIVFSTDLDASNEVRLHEQQDFCGICETVNKCVKTSLKSV